MKTLIVGGGLSGLALARHLAARGDDYVVLEGRDRFGGRILTEHHGAGYFDMGPAWFWPGQPRIAGLIAELGLEKFDQFADGILVHEDERGHVEHGRGFSSMQGSWRLKGGLGVLIDRLVAGLNPKRLRLNAEVATLSHTASGVAATLASGETVTADRVVLALPPRIAAGLTYAPTLPDTTLISLQNISTWMAGHAKAVAVYDTPIWRDAGLSGDAMSRHGPMVEIHDASPDAGGPYALFGFIGVPPQGRVDEPLLREHLKAQLGRLFGAEAAAPVKLYVKDWAFDPMTATQADQVPLFAHPTYDMPSAAVGLWDGRLHFSGTETAPQFGGYLEGALEAAELTFAALT